MLLHFIHDPSIYEVVLNAKVKAPVNDQLLCSHRDISDKENRLDEFYALLWYSIFVPSMLAILMMLSKKYVLCMHTERPLRCMLFSEAPYVWNMVPGGHSVTQQKSVKTLTSVLARVGTVRTPDWGPPVFPK